MKILIAGGGIGGLTTALSLHAAGQTDLHVFEAAAEIRQLGVGVNLPPHAVRELTELGLGDELARIGIPTSELAYYDRRGKLIWAETRGLAAGYRWPQYSIHRGRLQQMLYEALTQRLGEGSVKTSRRLTGFEQGVVPHDGVRDEARNGLPDGVRARVSDRDGHSQVHQGDLLVAADGIRSAARAIVYPDQGPLATNGWMMYRGTTQHAPFLSGTSMVIIGDEHLRVVVYPIGPDVINWLLVRPVPGEAGELGNWNRELDPRQVATHVHDWTFDWLDVPAMIAGSQMAWEYPMADFDPLPRWVFGRVALLGDAAHAMYPFGSNGASQAILDARVLAWSLATHPGHIDEALAVYEAERRPVASSVQLANRRQAGDVMARISALVRQDAHGAAKEELKAVEAQYKKLAGFDAETLNQRPSWSVVRT